MKVLIEPFWGHGWWGPSHASSLWRSKLGEDPMPPPFTAKILQDDASRKYVLGQIIAPELMEGFGVIIRTSDNKIDEAAIYIYAENELALQHFLDDSITVGLMVSGVAKIDFLDT